MMIFFQVVVFAVVAFILGAILQELEKGVRLDALFVVVILGIFEFVLGIMILEALM